MIAKIVKKKISVTLRNEISHLVVSLTTSIIIFLIFRRVDYSISSFVISFFVDADHWLDYFYVEGFKINLRTFFSGEYFGRRKKVLVLFHAWEYVTILLVAYLFFKETVFLIIALSLSVHYLVDQATNKVTKYAYFLTYRIKVNFALDKICLKV